jgi:hypothetical protein
VSISKKRLMTPHRPSIGLAIGRLPHRKWLDFVSPNGKSEVDISVDKVLFVNCGQSGSHLCCNFQRQFYIQPTCAFDEIFECLSLYELHRVEVPAPGFTRMEDRTTFG